MTAPLKGMTRTTALLLLLQVLAGVCAVTMTVWIWMPWPTRAALVLCVGLPVAGRLSRLFVKNISDKWWLMAGWVCALAAWGAWLAAANIWDETFAVVAWLIGVGAFFGAFRISGGPMNARWRVLALAWAFVGSVIWLGTAYRRNLAGEFYVGMAALLACLVLCRAWLRLPGVFVQLVNTLVLLLILLPLANGIMALASRVEMRPESEVKYFTYKAAKEHGAAFQRWWAYYSEQGNIMAGSLIESTNSGLMSFRLRPNGHCVFFQCPITINSKGFRGREISEEKGNAYRIVALGESTTFGYTIRTNDRPWPEVLEQMIRDRLKPNRPVEIINAGTPAYPLTANIERLKREILPLKPDMVISYHGYNGFPLLHDALPRLTGKHPPLYEQRPLKLLAECEYRLKMLSYRPAEYSKTFLKEPTFPPPLTTKYAGAYRELADLCRSNGIRLAVANFSMAVNKSSDLDVVEFYRSRFAAVYWQIEANLLHSKIVEAIGGTSGALRRRFTAAPRRHE